ncbi:protein kinase 61C, isoform F, partial [Reticulomyxa filosa]
LIAAVLREKKALYACQDIPFVMRIFGTAKNDHNICFITEYCPNGDLLVALRTYGAFTLASTQYYIACIISAMEHMHDRGIVHRDLKPENILLAKDNTPRISDFGCVKILPQVKATVTDQSNINNNNNNNNNNENKEERQSKGTDDLDKNTDNKNGNNNKRKDMKSDDPDFVGTPEFMAPELFEAHKYGGIPDDKYKCLDFWSIGCLIFQLLANKTLFKAPTEYLVFQKVSQWDYKIPSDVQDEKTVDLLQKLLTKVPEDRLGFQKRNDLRSHSFFKGIDWDKLLQITPPLINDAYLKKKEKKRQSDTSIFFCCDCCL